MITTEGITMKYPHFRIKVDLSKYFDDVRRFCWIFIDGTKIQQIFHIKQHISKLFNIAEPFHLLLNDSEYLPPTEDVRILKENEVILVVAGSGISDAVGVKVITCNGSVNNNETQKQPNVKLNYSTGTVTYDELDLSNNTQPTSINNITTDMTFYSVIEDTEEETDIKVTDNNLTEDCNMTDSVVSVPKRKRVRRRRPKEPSKLIVPSSDTNEKDKPKKPRIINSYIVPSGKHIRFDNMESDENSIGKKIAQEISRNESVISRTSSTKDLSTLLALGQCSTPITFMNKKMKNEVKMENVLNDEIRSDNFNIIKEENVRIENNSSNKETNKKTQVIKKLIHVDLDKIPIMNRKPQVKEIIAFKTLKIGVDYTPQVSNFILTEVIDYSAESANYTLKILDGKEEVQVPFGKFSISEDGTACHYDADTFILNYSQMQELRLIL